MLICSEIFIARVRRYASAAAHNWMNNLEHTAMSIQTSCVDNNTELITKTYAN